MRRIEIVGGGPAGLYAAYLLKRWQPSCEVTVWEQNPPNATYGFGVVFGTGVLERLVEVDPSSAQEITAATQSWSDQTIARGAERIVIDGGGFSGIARLTLLDILQQHCRAAGVQLRFNTRVTDVRALARDCDLLIGADGVNSVVRQAFAEDFRVQAHALGNRFAWYGVECAFPTHTLTFRQAGALACVAHHYRYLPNCSTFLIECDRQTWEDGGLGELSEEERQHTVSRLFTPELGEQPLLTNNSLWRAFNVLFTERWSISGVTLIGDALRSAHFSIGSGTRLAMEDAAELVAAVKEHPDRPLQALQLYETRRRPGRERFAEAAERSFLWYEDFRERFASPFIEFVHDYLMRTGRMSDARLRRESPRFMQAYDAFCATRTPERPIGSIIGRESA